MIRQDTCPICGSEALIASPMLTPWFCSNDDCMALAWDPYSTLAENLMNAGPVTVTESQPPAAGENQT